MNLMKNPPKIAKKTYANGTAYWLVTYSIKGKGQRKLKLDSEEAANEHKQEMIRKYMGGISMKEQEIARLAYEKFKAAQAGDKELAKIDIVELVTWACDNYQAPTFAKVEDLVDTFLSIKRKQGLRDATVYELEIYLEAFAKDFKGRLVESFTQKELETYLKRKYQWNKNRFGILKHFFAWLSGVSKATPNRDPILKDTPFRGWISGKSDDASVKNIVIYSSEESERILKIAGQPDFNSQGMFAFLLFSGCRPVEAKRIWEDRRYGWNLINLEKKILSLPASLTKTRRPRIININDTLLAWLKKYQDFETLLPVNWHDKYLDVRKEAKVNMAKDVTRHTFISQAIEQGMSFEQVALQCGNSKDIILRHYAALSSKEDSDKFFALTPEVFEQHDLDKEGYKAYQGEKHKETIKPLMERNKANWA